ncbi:polyhomeotic-proximal chromatin protein-like isoform X4 [Nymphalis io]|nr:polyhomeotic-proximal chromatin protein-like isoform X4 [Nymphalis io]
MSGEIKQQQIVDGQSQVVQQQINMSQHEPSQQHHQTVTVVSSMPSSMAQHQVQQQATSGIQQQATMPPLQSLPSNTQHPQQISAEWGHSRVQVIQQPLQNSTYLQQLYNAQGPLLMPGNIALHPGINSQQIQVIAAGKPFQGGQLAPHMLTTQGKQVLQGQAAPFPGYTTIPAIPTTQNQTFVFSPLGVINSQPSIIPAHSQSTVSGIGQQQKPSEMHKVMSGGKVTATKVGGAGAQTVPVQAQCVQVSQPVLGQQPQAQIISPLQTGSQTMQFAPWQISGALPQVWAGGLQAGTLPAGGLLAPNPIFIRGTQPDSQPSMFIQHSPQNNLQHTNASVACATGTATKPRASSDGLAKNPRPLSNILPSGSIRPAASVSTQTSANQAQNQAKQRGKPGVRSPAPTSKQDAANQTNKMQHQMQQPKQQLLVMNSSGQMTQITTDKQPLAKTIQQQAMLQQQAMQQQQHQHQQQQLLHQQHQTQQMVQHYQQQGMTLGMQQGTLPVGSVSQTLPMAGMPQTISMVQQIHPLSSMAQAGTLVGQINTSQNPQTTSLAQVQTLQQQPQTLVGSGLVQTSVGMAVQQSVLNHATQMQAGTMGLITTPVQGSVLPMQPQAALVTHVKNEEEKNQQVTQTAVVQQLSQSESVEGSVTETASAATPSAAATNVTADAAVSTTTSTGPNTPTEMSKSSPTKGAEGVSIMVHDSTSMSSTGSASSASAPLSSTAQHSTSVASQVVTTIACSSSTSSMTSANSSPGSSPALFKTSQSSSRHMSQQAVHDKGLPKAMVKPNILTHVIEGYVIQEAGEPFAVNRPLREWSSSDKEQDKENKLPSTDEPPRKKQMLDNGSSLPRISSSIESNEPTQHSSSKSEVPMNETSDSSADDAQAKIPNANKWTVAEVCDFIRNIPGCAGYADEFLMQEVDGEALLLIKPEHLVMALSMKLGPALKIVACIDSLRPESEQSNNDHD